MAKGNNTSEGVSKSRLVLGDLTNRMGKRGFSEEESIEQKGFSIIDKDTVKRPRPCTGITSLKGNAISSISKIPKESSGFHAVSKNSIDVETGKDDGRCAVGGDLKGYGVNKDINISQSVYELDIFDNDMVESSDESDNSSKDDVPCVVTNDLKANDANRDIKISQSVNELNIFDNDMDDGATRMTSRNHSSPTLVDLEGGRAVNSFATEADGCSGLDLLKENVIPKIVEGGTENKSPSLKHEVNVVDLTANDGGEVALDSSKLSNQNYPNFLGLDSSNAHQFVNEESGDTSRTISESCDIDQAKVNPKCTQSETSDYQNDTDNLVFSQSSSFDWTILPESQESRVFGLERTTKPKKEVECANMSGGIDSIRSCSCCFCTKAAYIWLDLNYQDIKARLSAMKKSQKEATILAERSCRNMTTDKHGSERLTRVSNTESNLRHQWRSLFQNMANVWGEEGNQLEASLLPLSDLKEKCKTNLELMNATPPEKH
ncbi:hypothetical protein ACJIZ3_018712 [Penstemon smallii]|uniref:Uncharacterized protein n=1 Tax=Penstemon smallii TaxID=265156 RepID=A0ABD3SZ70_9LAMI